MRVYAESLFVRAKKAHAGAISRPALFVHKEIGHIRLYKIVLIMSLQLFVQSSKFVYINDFIYETIALGDTPAVQDVTNGSGWFLVSLSC